jgi:TM2 domain-containing membrane protein YozV
MKETGSNEKNKVVAGVVAIFLGALGIHKFYLGRKKQGAIMLGSWLIAWTLIITIIGGAIGVPLLLGLHLTAFAEGVLMLIKSEDEFQRVYIDKGKAWF